MKAIVDVFDMIGPQSFPGMTASPVRSCRRSGRPPRCISEVRMSIDDHLEFRLLKYIVAIAEAGTFTAAAARLHVSQSDSQHTDPDA